MIKFVSKGLVFGSTLVFGDVHIGYEEALNKEGILIPRRSFEELVKDVSLMLKDKVDTIVINGDLKDEFGTINDQEWRNTLRFIDFLLTKCSKLVLVKGNHDTILGPIASKRGISIVDYYKVKRSNFKKEDTKFSKTNNNQLINYNNNTQKINPYNNTFKTQKLLKKSTEKTISKTSKIQKIIKSTNKKLLSTSGEDILIIHGDKIPTSDVLSGVRTIIIGHEHPAISIKDGVRVEKYKCFLVGTWKGRRLIVMPSFNQFNEGHDVIEGQSLSPFLDKGFDDFEVYIVSEKKDALYFGKVRQLI